MRDVLGAIISLSALTTATTEASSAVAVAINKNGGLGYGYSHAAVSEAEIRDRAIQQCSEWQGRDTKVIASTAKTGYGAIVMFQTADNKTNYTASLAAGTQQQAIAEALRKAAATGGHNADVIATWHDLPTYPNGAVAIAIYAPKPEYPAEAHAKHLIGAGVAVLQVDVPSGRVTSARMVQSTGHKILDDSTLDAFRKWRFQPGKAAPKVKIPIRYSLTGST